VLVGLAAVSLVGGAFATVGARGHNAQATVVSANSVHAYAGAPVLVSNVSSATPYAAIASTPSGAGYWVAAQDGGVFSFGSAGFFGSAGNLHLNQPIVGIASTPTGRGYWLVASDGGVFAFGDAHFYGSAGGRPLNAPIVGIAAAEQGRGYWLVAQDGGVFAFGDAPFLGSIAGLPHHANVTGIAAAPTHAGYWLVAQDGGVFTFGDATFAGSEAPAHVNDAAAIAASGTGYWIVRRDGSVLGFDTGVVAAATPATETPGAATVGIATRAGGGYWTVQAQQPDLVDHMNPFLVCTRSHESSHTPPAYDNGYQAVNPSGTYRGAYQFSQSTWNNAAMRAGRTDLVGLDPARASVPDQDLLALDLYHWQGAGPWMGRCGGL
jgi:ribosomal protein L24E